MSHDLFNCGTLHPIFGVGEASQFTLAYVAGKCKSKYDKLPPKGAWLGSHDPVLNTRTPFVFIMGGARDFKFEVQINHGRC